MKKEESRNLRILPVTFEFLHAFLGLEESTKICNAQYDIRTNTLNLLLEDINFSPIEHGYVIPVIKRIYQTGSGTLSLES